GGAAYTNAGIIDLGDRTLVVDAFDSLAAGRDLRQIAETLLQRPVETIILTHAHNDHWMGAPAFDPGTALIASETTRQVSLEWGQEIMEGYQNRGEWEDWLVELEDQLQKEKDERMRVGLEKTINRTRYTLAEMDEFQPRYANQTFEDRITFHGSIRDAELRSFGPGHSEDDAALLLPRDGIAFIGDIGFFDQQPFMGSCDIDRYRQQLGYFKDADFSILVPGHGPVGDKEHVIRQLAYFDVMEDLVGEVAQQGASFEEALQIDLPEPFDQWLMGSMGRFQVNVRYLFERAGGEVPAANQD
ncbi:MAG: MBL fold metallo-hydrolase, partial [Anaerolineales bacterium]